MKKKDDNIFSSGDVVLYKDHKLPTTRREFMAYGLIGASAYALGPDLNSLMNLSPKAMAQTCEDASCLPGNVPFLSFEGAGGMNIAGGNVTVGVDASEAQVDFGRNILSAFRKLGLHDTQHPSLSGQIDSTFGLKFHRTSGILAGLRESLSPTQEDIDNGIDLRNHVDGVLMCTMSDDDSNANPISTGHMAYKAGARGNLVQILGTNNTDSGQRSAAPQSEVNLLVRPSRIASFGDGESLISIGDAMMGSNFLNASDSSGGAQRVKSLMERLKRMSMSRFQGGRAPASSTMTNQASLYGDTLSEAKGIFDKFSPAALNPMSTGNADAQEVLKAFARGREDFTAITNNTEERVAAIANLVSKRVAGSGVITVGGCDYHDGTALRGFNKDREIGRLIGSAIRLFKQRGLPLFLNLVSDGSVVGDRSGVQDPAPEAEGRIVWRSDAGYNGAVLMIAFNPNRVRVNQNVSGSADANGESSNFLLEIRENTPTGIQTRKQTRQIGWFNEGEGVNSTSHSLANNRTNLWKGVMLNYLATQVDSTDDEQIFAQVETKFNALFGELPPDWKKFVRFRSLVA